MNRIPCYDSLAAAVAGCFGAEISVKSRRPVRGGDINEAACLDLSDGSQVFLKTNTLDNRGFFQAEETGFLAIAETRTIRTPRLLCRGIDQEREISFLMIEMVHSGKRIPDFWEVFGWELAEMHRADPTPFVGKGRFGFCEDNYIGASRQINEGRESWISFFRECRLEPQIRMAEGRIDAPLLRKLSRLLDRLDLLLEEPERPALLHGDLWAGNYITGMDGKAWLIDPAAYVGHPEADLAMTELFGGFSEPFYQAYGEALPLDSGYRDRRDLYNLYHLLNHLNLFGPAYLPGIERTVSRYL